MTEELCVGTECRGTSHLPEYGTARHRSIIDRLDRRIARGRQCASDLKHEFTLRISLVVEDERTGKLSGRREEVNTGCECHSAEVLSSQFLVER